MPPRVPISQSRQRSSTIDQAPDARGITRPRRPPPVPPAGDDTSFPGNPVGRFAARFVDTWSSPPASRSAAFRALVGIVMTILGAALLVGAARADTYLHRGIESGDDVSAVAHQTGRDLGVSRDFRDLDPTLLAESAATLDAAGVRFVRQPFVWAEIEPEPGSYVFSDYEPIVAAMGEAGMEVVAVLQSAPGWAAAAAPSGAMSPPADVADFAAFAAETARRFPEVRIYQIWDLPTFPESWGGRAAAPLAYADVLRAGSAAIRDVNPAAIVVTAEVRPARATGDGSDLAFIEALYDAGVTPSFDAVAIGIDATGTSPLDRWADPTRVNLSRPVLVRELMTRRGDPTTPVWMTSYDWVADGMSPPDAGTRLLVESLDRVRGEWPWMGPMFLAADMATTGSAAAGSTVDPLGPAERAALVERSAGGSTVAGPGQLPLDAPAVAYSGDWDDETVGDRRVRRTSRVGATVTIAFEGTAISTALRYGPSAGQVLYTIDGQPVAGTEVRDGASVLDLGNLIAVDERVVLAAGLGTGQHELRMTLASRPDAPGVAVDLAFGGATILQDAPVTWPVNVLAGISVIGIWLGVRELAFALALGARWLVRHRQLDLGPPLSGWQRRRRA